MANAMVSTVRPKASATPANPMPSPGYAAANIAAPQPPKTSQKVPNISAMERFNKDICGPAPFSKDCFDVLPALPTGECYHATHSRGINRTTHVAFAEGKGIAWRACH